MSRRPRRDVLREIRNTHSLSEVDGWRRPSWKSSEAASADIGHMAALLVADCIRVNGQLCSLCRYPYRFIAKNEIKLLFHDDKYNAYIYVPNSISERKRSV